MKFLIFVGCFCLLNGYGALGQVNIPKFDSTLGFGKISYSIQCSNKSAELNDAYFRLMGFEHGTRTLNYPIRGRIVGAETDDLNGDGYADLLLYLRTGPQGQYGTVYVLLTETNKSVASLALPDPLLDGKISPGYKGQDEFSLLQGVIYRKFPIYKEGDSLGMPSGGRRIVRYQLVPNERGGFKFQMAGSSDLK